MSGLIEMLDTKKKTILNIKNDNSAKKSSVSNPETLSTSSHTNQSNTTNFTLDESRSITSLLDGKVNIIVIWI